MTIQNRLSHATSVAKWKADQQARLFKSQSLGRELEGKIKIQKAILADTALLLFEKDKISEEELIKICSSISSLHKQIEGEKTLQENVKNEAPPAFDAYSSDFPTSQNTDLVNEELSGLVCPQCNRQLVGTFCPEHGVEGVENLDSPSKKSTDDEKKGE